MVQKIINYNEAVHIKFNSCGIIDFPSSHHRVSLTNWYTKQIYILYENLTCKITGSKPYAAECNHKIMNNNNHYNWTCSEQYYNRVRINWRFKVTYEIHLYVNTLFILLSALSVFYFDNHIFDCFWIYF